MTEMKKMPSLKYKERGDTLYMIITDRFSKFLSNCKFTISSSIPTLIQERQIIESKLYKDPKTYIKSDILHDVHDVKSR